MTEAPPPSRVSDLPTRFAMAVAMIAVASLAIFMGGWPFRLLVLVGAALMLVEWADMHGVRRLWAWLGAALMAVNLLVVAEYLFPAGAADVLEMPGGGLVLGLSRESFEPAWYGFAATAVLALVTGLGSRRWNMAWGYFYIAAPALALVTMSWAWLGLVFWVMLVTWSTDIFAYFAGRSLGGPKLAPRISPNKTWSGLIGGMAGAGVIGWLAAAGFDLGAPFTWLGAAMGFIAQAGDLYESWEKRRCGVKDSGTILPGHGGMLDRADGLLAVSVATMLLLLGGMWTA